MSNALMKAYADRPWQVHYADVHRTSAFQPRYADALSLFEAAVAQGAEAPALCYFDQVMSYGELDHASDSLAGYLLEQGFAKGDRLALFLQNVPGFVIGLVAAWKIGGVPVSINPMNRERELTVLLRDCQPRALLTHGSLYRDVVAGVVASLADTMPAPWVITSAEQDFQARNDPRVQVCAEALRPAATMDLLQLLAQRQALPAPARVRVQPGDVAVMVYTSGTTGVPKGALNTHGNFVFNAEMYRSAIMMRDRGPVLGIAPLFHITGLIGHIGAAFACAAPLILSLRFHPQVMAESVQEHQAEFTIGAITAFIALLNEPQVTRAQLASLRNVYSGGAPIPVSIVEQFEHKFGPTIRNGYGLTESTSPLSLVPSHQPCPYDAENGALSIGVPVFETDMYIADDAGQAVAVGEVGEILARGPQVVPGYWQREEASREAFHHGYLRTGDMGYMNAQGWFFLVDRKKDMINASGYKVWPREVEEVLYTHPAVLEAAVVGVPDAYRGESVKAIVSLKPGAQATEQELIAYCKERMAAYKYPRVVAFRENLPKTPTGKILRRELR